MARDSIRCSFCGKRQEQVNRIIAGPNVYICNECIDLCSSILRDEMKNGETQDLELPDTLPTPQEIKTYMDRYIIGQDEARSRCPWRFTIIISASTFRRRRTWSSRRATF